MDNSPQSPDSNKSKQKWITDFAMMTNINRFILSTGDRELQFFETSTFEPYCQIRFLPTVKCHFLLILCYVCFRGTNTFEPYCQIRFLPTVTFCWFCVMFVSVTGGTKSSVLWDKHLRTLLSDQVFTNCQVSLSVDSVLCLFQGDKHLRTLLSDQVFTNCHFLLILCHVCFSNRGY